MPYSVEAQLLVVVSLLHQLQPRFSVTRSTAWGMMGLCSFLPKPMAAFARNAKEDRDSPVPWGNRRLVTKLRLLAVVPWNGPKTFGSMHVLPLLERGTVQFLYFLC